jgi:tripartite-type tricarboxylate transporter receptor subunit TctC
MTILRILLWLALLPASAMAQQSYPTKPVKIVIPFAPGGASDFVGRIIQPKLAEQLNQQVIIENRPGASGNIAVEAVARSAPDGYTIFLGNVGSIAVNPAVFPNLPVNPLRDLAAVTQVVDVPGLLVAHPSFPPNSVKELVAYVKANPGKVNYASPGSGSQNRLEAEVLRKLAGLDMVHVPYKGGAGPAVAGLAGGETQLMFVTASSAMPLVKAGRIKALAATAAKRIEQLPDVPTMQEAGYAGFDIGSWQGIFVPAGTPPEVIHRLFVELKETMKSPDVIERLKRGGVEVVFSDSPTAFTVFVGQETQRWGKVAKEAGATVD